MIKIRKYILGFGLVTAALTSFTSCIDETEPTDIATEKQIGESDAAGEGLLMAMPAFFNNFDEDFYSGGRYGRADYNFGYGAMMRARSTMADPMVSPCSGFDWFSPWAEDISMGQDASRSNYTWTYYYKFIQATNNILNAYNDETATDTQKGYIGAAKAFRALCYLDLGQMYEFLPNDKTSSVNADGNDVTGLTVPIVREGMTQDEARNNPRVTKDSLVAFIKSDLEGAEQDIQYLTNEVKTLPHIDAVYGLEARLYMWTGEYAKAEEAATKAIQNSSVSPMTQNDALNTTTGFNDISKWMWGSQLTSEDNTVQTGIMNWVSFCSNESTFGYMGSATGDYLKIDTATYNRISNTDWRKLEWKAPNGSALASRNSYIDKSEATSMPALASLKWRPNQGNVTDPSIGAASAFPIMRVEEMYFIQAEAAAHQNAERGKQLLETFMRSYRDPQYSCSATSQEDIINEIIFQKSIEFWGEGILFFDMKRLNIGITRGYVGTNWPSVARLNTNGRPAFFNLVIYRSEAEGNTALAGWNNPDPTSAYTPWVGTQD